jgi:methylglutaconyl-CoA hydratase
MESFKYLAFEIKDRLGYITLNRPEKRNALNFPFIREIKTALELAENDPNIKVIIIKGSGKAFCAGADLEYLAKLQEYSFNENLIDSTNLMELYATIYRLKKVVIAEVNGDALAGGCGLVTVCDFAFAAADAKFGYTEVKIGFIPAIVMVFLVRKIGEGRARELLLSGDKISASTALGLGIISAISAPHTLSDDVFLFAQKLCKENSAGSMELVKRMLLDTQQLPLGEALNFAAKMNAHARGTIECKRGIASFLNKVALEW